VVFQNPNGGVIMTNGFNNVNYDKVNPWKFLDNLAVNATILKASYNISSQTGLANKCDDIVTLSLELKRLIHEAHM
jgi:hypothetical protein